MSVLKKPIYYDAQKMYSVRFLSVCIFLIFFVFGPGCSHRPQGRTPKAIYLANTPLVDLNNAPLVRESLSLQFRQWQGTHYKLGGLDRNGIDCSGFVYLTYRTRFGIKLPRSTEEQIETGQDVTRERLRPGDLLFFSTGFFDDHVGIYLENRNFIHASKNKGVILSNLDDQYWRSSFRKAKRIRID